MVGEAASGFAEFAGARTRVLLRSAWLLTGDWHLAQDLVQEALVRVFEAWERIEVPEAFAQTALVRVYLSMRRRRMYTERPADVLPDSPVEDFDPALRLTLIVALTRLSRTDRAVLVLRYLYDRSVDQVAHDLGRSPAAIRTMTRRALERLRADLGPGGLADLGLPTGGPTNMEGVDVGL